MRARCGKWAYPTARAAWRAVAGRCRELHRRRVPLAVYRCPVCHQWHLRTQIDRIARRRSWGRRRREEADHDE